MTPVIMAAFSDEMEKLSALPPKQEKEGPLSGAKSSLKRNIGLGTLAAGGATALLALKNPRAAKGYFRHAKEIVTKPGKSMARGWRSGRVDINSGAGASEAASKRVGMYRDTFRAATGKKPSLLQHDTLTNKDPGFLRKQNILSVGERKAKGLKLDKDLQRRVQETQNALDSGKRIPEEQLRALYDEIGQAGRAQGLKPGAGIMTYMPGERALNVGMGTAGGAYEGLQTEDPETGRKRGVGERLARGAMGAGTGVALGHMFMGRGTGLDSRSLFGGRGLVSQKGLLPLAAGGVLASGEGIAADAAGGAGRLVDRAFGQGE
jgi:hypothetical protein